MNASRTALIVGAGIGGLACGVALRRAGWTVRIHERADAAHPLLPHTGQGAAQALEDAVALGLAVSTFTDIAIALRQYESVRSRRTRRFVMMGPRIARVTTTRNIGVTALRSTAIRLIPERLLARLASRGRDPRAPLRQPAA